MSKNYLSLFDLNGKTALITGASSGLGERFAYCLSQAGARVILAARRLDKLQVLAKTLPNAIAIKMDVADKTSVQAAFAELEKRGEKIDICINNAGIAKLTPIFSQEDNDDFANIMQTNTLGVWYVTQAVAHHMRSHKLQGSIINIASVNGANLLRENITAYAASKAAVIQMTKALTGELSREKIRINAILPGLFHTPLTDHRLNTEELRREMENLIPLNFVAEASDLDGAILFLASHKASRYVTGSCLTIDGGISWGG
jgi:NAD(P)-dependent dehydrogenase (short-subunit alcohol dehydrogenase family)